MELSSTCANAARLGRRQQQAMMVQLRTQKIDAAFLLRRILIPPEIFLNPGDATRTLFAYLAARSMRDEWDCSPMKAVTFWRASAHISCLVRDCRASALELSTESCRCVSCAGSGLRNRNISLAAWEKVLSNSVRAVVRGAFGIGSDAQPSDIMPPFSSVMIQPPGKKRQDLSRRNMLKGMGLAP